MGLFHSITLNTKINLLHYRTIKFAHQDELSTFQELLIKDNSVSVHHRNIQFKELLIKDNSVSVHHRNIQFQAIELFKVISGNVPFLVDEIFTRRVIPENSVVANLRSQTDFYNYHNPQCSIWNRNVTCPRAKDMEYNSTRY